MTKKEMKRSIKYSIIRCLKFVPDSVMLKVQYRLFCKRTLNLENPKRFSEKIQKYKINYRNDLLGICVDKYRVRDYIKQKGLEYILNDLYQVVDYANEIDWKSLPEKFVIKTTDGSNGDNIVIIKDKSTADFNEIKKKLKLWKNKKNVCPGREWAYTQIDKSRIVIEKYLENEKNPEAGLEDYKILCFNGKPEIVIIDKDRYLNHSRNFYDTEWNQINAESDCPNFPEDFKKPDNLEEMLTIAQILSSDFPFVRVDLYNVSGKIIFGELTFYPWSGYVTYNPDSFDFDLGKKFNYFD